MVGGSPDASFVNLKDRFFFGVDFVIDQSCRKEALLLTSMNSTENSVDQL